MKHTISELQQWQGLPLNIKVAMTKQRIRDWVREFGLDGVYVSFSGGKDSTVLLHIAREMYGNEIKAVFSDTGLEYPEIRRFVKGFDNVDWVRPKKSFKKVCEEHGFPIISKEVSEKAYYAKRYFDWWLEHNHESEKTNIPTPYGIADLFGMHGKKGEAWDTLKRGDIPEEMLSEIFGMDSDAPAKAKILMGTYRHKEKGVPTNEASKMFDFSRWKFLVASPFWVSHKCCGVMKKSPMDAYKRATGRLPITAQMAEESRLRTSQWLRVGCNAYQSKKKASNPMSFWTEQDVLLYIVTHGIEIASVYGDIVTDYEKMGQIEGQMSVFDFMGDTEQEKFAPDREPLKTTECQRTGCVFCGFGCHLEKGESRFQRLKRTHPKHYKAMANIKNNGINYFEAIDWINEHNGKGEIIRY